MENFRFITGKLIEWYKIHRRILPWRGTNDPYLIWISEIILQQTRVIQGLDYYNRFIGRFPDVRSLAAADEQEVLKYWQGLGYYSRARNLHATARSIETNFGGVFPEDYETILSLKGIGEYTAAAIASIAFNAPYPVVDGNVFRFLSRLFAVEEPIDTAKGKNKFTELAGRIMDPSQPGLFNQAIMEFGALQCVPVSPDCSVCPFEAQCSAYSFGRVNDFPIKRNKTKVKTIYLYYFHIRSGIHIYLKKRKEKGIWQNLYEFPHIESETPLEWEDLIRTNDFQAFFPSVEPVHFRLVLKNQKHVLTHRILFASFYEVEIEKTPVSFAKFIAVPFDAIDEYPIHRLMQMYVENYEL
ncbi:MAG: A/G-specific adenine glycosylase [Candidatus Azobacteroides sp.]|nr:A/G-specific adenine glycosylase [Candidatus Azobacteroides sp.]